MEYRRGSLTEWYMDGPLGLEQGFTLAAPPGRKHSGPLTVALALSGDLTAVAENATDLALQDHDRRETLRYAGLTSYDAKGKHLRTWIEVRGRKVRLRVEDLELRIPWWLIPGCRKESSRLRMGSGTVFLETPFT